MAVFLVFLISITVTSVSAYDPNMGYNPADAGGSYSPVISNNTNIINTLPNTENQTAGMTDNSKNNYTEPAKKVDPKITIKNKTAKTNSSTTLEAILPSDATGKGVFKINDITIGEAFKVNGGHITYNYSIPLYSAKDYTIKFVYTGNDKYNSARPTGILTLNKLKTHATVKTNKTNVTQGDTILFNVTLRNQLGNGAQNKFVVKINGKSIGSNTTDINGKGQLYYTLPMTYKINTYNVTVKFGETNTAFATNATTNFTINNPTRTTLKSLPVTKTSKNVTLNATVTDKRNRNVTTGQVVFKINGLTIAKVNVTNGSANYQYNIPLYGAKAYNITALYGGNSYYKPSNSTKTLNLTKLNTKTKASNFNVTVGSTNSTKINVKDELNRSINGKVNLIVNNKTINTFTVINGSADIKYTPQNNESNSIVKYTLEFVEDNYYKKSAAIAYIVVKPLTTVYVSNNGNNNNLGDMNNPYKTISYAKDHVANSGIIYLTPGQYNESNITLNKSLNIYGTKNSSNIIINANKNGFIFNNTNSNSYLSLRNITIRNAKIGQDNSAAVISNGRLDINACKFENNTATTNSSTSSIYAKNNLTITSSIFKNNKASANGGAIHTNGHNVIILTSQFTNNTVSGNNIGGGALYLYNSTTIIENTQFNSNNAKGINVTGGAIKKYNGNLTLNHVTLTKNTLSGSQYVVGAAISNYYSQLYIINSTITNNNITSNDYAGGAALFNQNSIMLAYNSTISSNKITGKNTYGGALFNTNSYITLNIVNITSNNALSTGNISMGGAINSNGGTLSVTKTKINNNMAKAKNAYGGAIYFAGSTLNINDTLISKNLANATTTAIGGAIVSGANNSINKSNFTNNMAKAKTAYAGAIFNTGNLSIEYNNFLSNNATTGANAVFNNNGTVKTANNNYWSTSSPNWKKLIYGFKQPSKYSTKKV